jgi:hypothetical protein
MTLAHECGNYFTETEQLNQLTRRLTEYDIDEAQLSNDLDELVQKLVDNGLVEVVVE